MLPSDLASLPSYHSSQASQTLNSHQASYHIRDTDLTSGRDTHKSGSGEYKTLQHKEFCQIGDRLKEKAKEQHTRQIDTKKKPVGKSSEDPSYQDGHDADKKTKPIKLRRVED